MNNAEAQRRALDAFTDMASKDGLRRRPAQSLRVPYFRGELNRCVEHMTLNRMLRSPVHSGDPGWYQVGMACRTNDTKKVEFGWHSTVFEMLTTARHQRSGDFESIYGYLAEGVVEMLTVGIGLDAKRLRVTYCAGGEVLPGVVVEADDLGRRNFVQAGLHESQTVSVAGPKNFVLFVGDGERTGPKYEVLYLINTGGRERWIEVATAIVDRYVLRPRRGAGGWELRDAESVVAGCAFGLERLIAAQIGGGGIYVSPVISELLSVIRDATGQGRDVINLLEGDCLILADLVRSTSFLMADGMDANGATVEGRLIISLLRRIRRKIAILCFRDWERVLMELEGIVARHYEQRYPSIVEARDRLVAEVASLPWPESWNPDSYDPSAETVQDV